MGEGEGGIEKGSFSPSALSFFRFHLSPFPQKRLILRLHGLVIYSYLKEGAFTAVKANLQFDAVTPLACDSWFLLSFEHFVVQTNGKLWSI